MSHGLNKQIISSFESRDEFMNLLKVIPGLVISIVNRRKPNSFPVDRGGAADDFGHRMAVMSSHLRMLFALLLSE